MHLNLQKAVAGAGLAPAAARIERKAPRPVAARLGVLRGGEEIADFVEKPRVRRRVRARRAPDGALVDADDLVEVLQPLDAAKAPRVRLHAVELDAELFIENLVDERGLAAAGDARDAGERPERDGDVDVLEVVLPRAAYGQELPVSGAADGGHLDFLFSAEILPRQALRVRHDLRRRTRRDNLAAV